MRCHFCDLVPEDCGFRLVSRLCCLLGLHASVKQAVILDRLTCKEWRAASNQHPQELRLSVQQPLSHWSCQQPPELQSESFLGGALR